MNTADTHTHTHTYRLTVAGTHLRPGVNQTDPMFVDRYQQNLMVVGVCGLLLDKIKHIL